MFIPRLYGPDNLVNVGGIAWTDQQGLKEGHVAKFVMRDERQNFFHITIPVVGQPQLREVRVELSSTFPDLTEVWVHAGGTRVNDDSTVFKETTPAGPNSITTVTVENINKTVDRGICISLGFTTVGGGLGQGEISFYAAGAIFA
jgi:hypothetical protein